jgi:integrase/recombinase XerD
MSALDQAAEQYLALRRSLGHQLADAGRLLPRFVAYLEQHQAETVTIEAALAWAQQPDVNPASTVWARRLTVARGFACHMAGVDPRTQIPPAGLIGYRQRRRPPFVFSTADVAAVMAQARLIRWPLPAATYETLIGLLAATGMRVGEAIRLDRADIDWSEGVLLIRRSKFTKSRQVALHPSVVAALRRYDHDRDRLQPLPATASFFVSVRGTRLIYQVVHEVFGNCCRSSGVGAESAVRPRIHDLRHSFAVRCLLEWYRQGVDVQARLPWLSAYLGHRDPRSTYWYLSAAPELLAHAARLLEQAAPTQRPAGAP